MAIDDVDHIPPAFWVGYPMRTLFTETVPLSEDTWIECLGDLAPYRMVIEDGDPNVLQLT
jgi:hypothetical protein